MRPFGKPALPLLTDGLAKIICFRMPTEPNVPFNTIKRSDSEYFVIETKGLKDLDVPLKIKRLKLWCNDINQEQNEKRFDFE
jgi:hypothetical protein